MKIEKQVKDKNLNEIINNFKIQKQVYKTNDSLFNLEILKKSSKFILNDNKYINEFQAYFNGTKIKNNIATLNIIDIKELQEIINNFYIENNFITKEHNIFKAINDLKNNINSIDIIKTKQEVENFISTYNIIKNEEFFDSRLENYSMKWKYEEVFNLSYKNGFYYLETDYYFFNNAYKLQALLNEQKEFSDYKFINYKLYAKKFNSKEECLEYYFNQDYLYSLFIYYLKDVNFIENNTDDLYSGFQGSIEL